LAGRLFRWSVSVHPDPGGWQWDDALAVWVREIVAKSQWAWRKDPLVDVVRGIVKQAGQVHASGSYKRQWAYSRLIRLHPDRKQDIGLMIEQIVRGEL
jgi:hypothetical protein